MMDRIKTIANRAFSFPKKEKTGKAGTCGLKYGRNSYCPHINVG